MGGTNDFVSLLSTVLGYLVILGSALFQLPQIYTILSKRSAEGISLMYYFVETLMFAAATAWGIAYGLPLSTYGENILVVGQCGAVMLLVGHFNNQMRLAGPAVVGLLAGTAVLALRLAPPAVLQTVYAAQVGNTILAKVPQIVMNHRRRGTGALSLFTVLLMFAGAAVRVFTTVVTVSWEQGKAIMVAGFGCSLVLNGIMVAQFFVYASPQSSSSSSSVADENNNNNTLTLGKELPHAETQMDRGGEGGGEREIYDNDNLVIIRRNTKHTCTGKNKGSHPHESSSKGRCGSGSGCDCSDENASTSSVTPLRRGHTLLQTEDERRLGRANTHVSISVCGPAASSKDALSSAILVSLGNGEAALRGGREEKEEGSVVDDELHLPVIGID